MKRDQALDHVKTLTTSDRNQTHGNPVQQFHRAQRIKEAVGHRDHPELTPAEIECIEMICTKLSRWVSGKRSQVSAEKWAEHPLDIIGYAAIAVEGIYAVEAKPQVMEVDKPAPVVSPFAGADQGLRRFQPNPRKENPTDGSAA
jgi:hypothetical protein